MNVKATVMELDTMGGASALPRLLLRTTHEVLGSAL